MATENEVLNVRADVDVKEISTVNASLDQMSNALKDVDSQAGSTASGADKLASAFDKAKAMADGFNEITGAMGTALGYAQQAFDATIQPFINLQEQQKLFSAQTGITGDDLEGFGDIANTVFRGNFGENLPEVYEAMGKVRTITGETGDELQDTTQRALTFDGVFDKDITETMRSVNSITKAWGISSKEAFDLLTYGMQVTGDPADDLLDTFNEYSVALEDIGLSSTQSLGLMNQFLDKGGRNTDVLADGLKEFGIRYKDLSSMPSIMDVFEGMDGATDIIADFNGGFMDTTDVLATVLEGLRQMEDPIARNAAGVAIFGTQWEDFGSAILELDFQTITEDMDGLAGASDRTADTMDNGITPAVERLKRQLSGIVMDNFEDDITSGLDGLTAALGVFSWAITPEIVPPDPASVPTVTEMLPASGNVVEFTIQSGDTPQSIAARTGAELDAVTQALRDANAFVRVGVDPDLGTFANALGRSPDETRAILEAAGVNMSAPMQITVEMALQKQAEGDTRPVEEIIKEMQADAALGAVVNLPTTITPEFVFQLAQAAGVDYATMDAAIQSFVSTRESNSILQVGVTGQVVIYGEDGVEYATPLEMLQARFAASQPQGEQVEIPPVEVDKLAAVVSSVTLAIVDVAGVEVSDEAKLQFYKDVSDIFGAVDLAISLDFDGIKQRFQLGMVDIKEAVAIEANEIIEMFNSLTTLEIAGQTISGGAGIEPIDTAQFDEQRQAIMNPELNASLTITPSSDATTQNMFLALQGQALSMATSIKIDDAWMPSFQSQLDTATAPRTVEVLVDLNWDASTMQDNVRSTVRGAITGIRDSGGSGVAGGSYLIGTGAQPELFVPDTAGQFYPAGQYGGGGMNANITLNIDGQTVYNAMQNIAMGGG